MSAKLIEKKLFIFDTETTGLPHEADRISIIEIAGVVLDLSKPGYPEIGDAFKERLKLSPGAHLGAYAMKMHRDRGWTQTKLNMYGSEPAAVYERLLAYVESHGACRKNQMYMGGHNAAVFDIPLLKRDAVRHGISLDDIFDHHPIDTAIMAHDRYGPLGSGELERVSLKVLAPFLGVEFDEKQAHAALYDVRVTAECYRRMKAGSVWVPQFVPLVSGFTGVPMADREASGTRPVVFPQPGDKDYPFTEEELAAPKKV